MARKQDREVKMLYRVTIESFNALTGEITRQEFRANSLLEAQMIEHTTDPENARERNVTVEPDVLAYLKLYHPRALRRLYPDSH